MAESREAHCLGIYAGRKQSAFVGAAYHSDQELKNLENSSCLY
jgi:hypothetical protein